jgi:4-amino-4-deoxy-L-arabinose transferase-like glycosyltransferase
MKNQKLSHYVIITVALILFFGLLLFRLDEPMFGHREGAVVWIASSVRMYNQYGADVMRFLPVRTMGPATPEGVYYYLHHPPFTVWWSALGTWLFGYDSSTGTPYESSIRYAAILVTMPTVCLLYALAKRLTDKTSALIGFLLFSFTPMMLYFGRTPIFDFMVLPFVLLFAYVFVDWIRNYSRRGTIWLMIWATISIWVAWAGTPTIAAIGLLAFLYGNKRHKVDMLIIFVWVVLATVAIPVLYEMLKPGAVTALLTVFLFRVGNTTGSVASTSDMTPVSFILQLIRDLMTVVSLALSVFGIWGTILFLMRRRDLKAAILLAFIAGPVVFMLIFRNAFYFHDWYEVAFMPGFAMIAGWVIYRGWQIPPDGLRRFVKPLIVAIVVTSLGLSAYWTVLLHQVTLNPFTRALAAELALYTPEIPYQADDVSLATNVSFPFDEVDYNAYRNIVWGVALEELEDFYMSNELVELDYFYCPEDDETEEFSGIFADFPYEIIAENCRLMHITKGQP